MSRHAAADAAAMSAIYDTRGHLSREPITPSAELMSR